MKGGIEVILMTACGCISTVTVDATALQNRMISRVIHRPSPSFYGEDSSFPSARTQYYRRDFVYDGDEKDGKPVFYEVYRPFEKEEWEKRLALLQEKYKALERQFYFIDEGL